MQEEVLREKVNFLKAVVYFDEKMTVLLLYSFLSAKGTFFTKSWHK